MSVVSKAARFRRSFRIPLNQLKGHTNMNSQILGLRVAGVIFGLMCLAQLLRLVIRPEVLVAGHQVPLLAQRAGLDDFGWPQSLDVEALPHRDSIRVQIYV
jgi:hypothetical protein